LAIPLSIALMAVVSPADSVAKKKPDLRVTAVSTSATRAAGGGLDAADSTGNVGKWPAPRSTTGFLLSRDERRDKTDLVLDGQRAVPKLKPRGRSGGRARLGVAPSTPAGRYRLLACADIAGRIAEANESNNCKASAGFVEIVASGKGPTGPIPPATTSPMTTPPETTPPDTIPPEPFAGAAFRFTDLDLRDPHVVIDYLGARDVTDTPFVGFSINGELQEQLTTDGDEDGLLDLSPVNLFDPFDQEASTMPAQIDLGAACAAPPQPIACKPGTLAAIATTATNASAGTCLDVLAETTYGPYTPEITTPTAPCFATDEMELTLSLAGIPMTLEAVRVAATYVGDPATAETNGLARGFISEANADATIIPASYPLVGGKPLSSLFPGGTDNPSSHSDLDTRAGVSGWWMYLNFTASPTPWAP
jgi:hypothetical protein